MGEAHFLEGGAFGFHLLEHAFDGGLAVLVQAFAEVFLRNTDDLALDACVKLCAEIFGRPCAGGVVVRVDSADGRKQCCAVGDGGTEGTDLVQAAGVSQKSIAGHAAVGGLKAHHPCAGGRLTDRSAGIGAQRTGDRARGHGYGRASGGTSRYAGTVQRVLHGAEVRGLVAGAHGEFVHVGLAHDDGTCRLQLFDGSGGVGGYKVFENLGGCRSAGAFEAHVVLHGYGNPVQRTQGLAFGAALVAFFGPDQRPFVKNRNIGVQVLGSVNLAESGLYQSFGGRLPAFQLFL